MCSAAVPGGGSWPRAVRRALNVRCFIHDGCLPFIKSLRSSVVGRARRHTRTQLRIEFIARSATNSRPWATRQCKSGVVFSLTLLGVPARTHTHTYSYTFIVLLLSDFIIKHIYRYIDRSTSVCWLNAITCISGSVPKRSRIFVRVCSLHCCAFHSIVFQRFCAWLFWCTMCRVCGVSPSLRTLPRPIWITTHFANIKWVFFSFLNTYRRPEVIFLSSSCFKRTGRYSISNISFPVYAF